ncbi:hypothetical protein [Polyangium sp. y55x31]|uniref:hypothetical protein n=1 Tax=Polyangium sp. y55x31 TaxID=3042688 RepID=UPI0024825068|nr:hypothetical protein [Polyangium sp. y55x31]MDI1483153.1 hypothetical protein [Polyangium sp. y55x31]
MPKPDPRVLARTAGNYLKEHPEEIVRALRSALGLRASIPMDALRYLAREFVPDNKKAPKDIVIEAAPPGIRVAATVDAMGTPLRASLILHIEEIAISLTEMRIGVRVEGLTLTVLGDSASPLAGLLKSGALDLSKPGNLVAFMPKRPPMLVEAKDDRLTLDLMKVPKIAENPKVRRYLSIVLPVASVRAIRTKDDHLDVHLKANLGGISQAIAAARQTV